MKFNKKTTIIIAIVVVAAGLLFYFRSAFVAAMVNGSPISRIAVIRELEKNSGKQALESLINKKLIVNEASGKGVTVSAEEIDAKIAEVDKGFKAQGTTLEEAMKTEGVTMSDLREQIKTNIKLEKLLADKTQVTDEEVAKFIKDNKVPVEKGKEAEVKEQVKSQLKSQKFNQEASKLIESLRASAKISHLVNY